MFNNASDYTYKEFYSECANKPRRTERAQRRDIDNQITALFEKHDYHCTELLRKLATLFVESNGDDSASEIYLVIDYLLRSADSTRRSVRIFTQHSRISR